MELNFNPFFDRYKAVVNQADQVFSNVQVAHPDCVKCKVGCADCCHALFDVSLVEAIYISQTFRETIPENEKPRLLELANLADRKTYKIKRSSYKAFKQGGSEADVFATMSQARVRCPMLDDQDRCEIYAFRPITCRFYGIPTAIGGAGHTCGKSAFEKGNPYPTVNLDAIHSRLYEISDDLAKSISSTYPKLGEMLVPLSMALLTDYTPEYLGISEQAASTDKPSVDE